MPALNQRYIYFLLFCYSANSSIVLAGDDQTQCRRFVAEAGVSVNVILLTCGLEVYNCKFVR
jgi:hypothetical protein